MTAWRGVTLDQRSADMMNEVVRLCPGINIDPTQGSYSGSVGASAGTHSGGGAIDLSTLNLSTSQCQHIVLQMRIVGWAAWLREVWEGDWPRHIHGIAVGCPDLSNAARDQVTDYKNGRNGLANNGKDTGPRDFHYPGITFEEYLENLEEDMPSPEEVAAAVWAHPMTSADGNQYAAQAFLEQSNMQAEDVINYPIPPDGGHLWAVLRSTLDAVQRIEARLDGS